MFSSHIKAPVLKQIILEEKPCEEKLNDIKELLGIPSEGTVSEENAEPAADDSMIAKERVLANLTATEKKLGSQVLEYIQTSNFISWNPQTLQIILDGKEIEYSNIEKLIKKLVQTASPVLPIAFVLFIEALVKLKLPLNLFRDGDAVNTRAQLLLMKENTSESEVVNETHETNSQPEQVAESANENKNENVEKSLKRKRVQNEVDSADEGENYTARSKKRKVALSYSKTPTDSLNRKQRSPKLKQAIIDAGWKNLQQ